MLEREYYDDKMQDCKACTGSYGVVEHASMDEMQAALPEAYSVILLPKCGSGDPMKAVQESDTLRLRQGELA